MGIRLVGLDLDGTALDPGGKLSSAVCGAVARMQARGIRVVICTGRRFRTAVPLARELSLAGPMVVNNGGLVKDVETARTRFHQLLAPDLYHEILPRMREHGPPLVYVDTYHDDTDVITERVDAAHAYQREYLADQGEFCRVVPDLAQSRPDGVIMMSTMADTASLEALRERVLGALGDRVRSHSLINKNYRGDILEFLSPATSKWTGLRWVAQELGVDAADVAAIGDDTNDIDMLENAGLGIAMGNAVQAAKDAARVVVRSNAEGGAVEALERVLLAR